MNHASKQPALPALTVDLLQESGILIDNVPLGADPFISFQNLSFPGVPKLLIFVLPSTLRSKFRNNRKPGYSKPDNVLDLNIQ